MVPTAATSSTPYVLSIEFFPQIHKRAERVLNSGTQRSHLISLKVAGIVWVRQHVDDGGYALSWRHVAAP